MDGPQLLQLLVTASILLLVFALGARATFADATCVVRESVRPPYWLLRALVAMYVVVPATAVGLGIVLDLERPIRVGLLALAVAPIPPILPRRQLELGGSAGHVFGLLVAVSLCAIVQVPLMVDVLGRLFGREASFGPGRVAAVIGMTILIPLTAGLVVRWLTPRWASRAAPWASRLGTVLLAIAVIAILVKAGPMMISLVRGDTMFAIVAMTAIAIGAGHWIGGPNPSDRAILAFASAMRHPALALAVATANVPQEPRLFAVILLYVLVSLVMTTLYAATIRRQQHLRAAA
jgi:BASS family bile acid:Na+ symporter